MLSYHIVNTFSQLLQDKPSTIELIVEIETRQVHMTEGFTPGTNVLSCNCFIYILYNLLSVSIFVRHLYIIYVTLLIYVQHFQIHYC